MDLRDEKRPRLRDTTDKTTEMVQRAQPPMQLIDREAGTKSASPI